MKFASGYIEVTKSTVICGAWAKCNFLVCAANFFHVSYVIMMKLDICKLCRCARHISRADRL